VPRNPIGKITLRRQKRLVGFVDAEHRELGVRHEAAAPQAE
jgi:hypothetical protein